jgi:hypothetical protein
MNGAVEIPQPPLLPIYSARPQEVQDVPARKEFAFDSMKDALAAFARGEFLVVADDESRENEGDLIIAASEVSTEKMAWMIRHTRCASYSLARGEQKSNTFTLQWLHLHLITFGTTGGAGNTHDGRAKRRSSPNSLHCYGGLQIWYACPNAALVMIS